MPKLNLKPNRPKSKKEALQERRNLVIAKNHLDLEEERRERKELFLDDGGETSDDDEAPPNEIPWKQQSNSRQEEPEKNDDDEEKNEDSEPGDAEWNLNGNDLNGQAGLLDEDALDAESMTGFFGEGESDAESNDANVDSLMFPQTRKRKIVFSDAAADGDLGNGILHFNAEDSACKIVALNAANSSKLIKPKVNFREELLRSTTDRQRMKGLENKSHVEKWRRVY